MRSVGWDEAAVDGLATLLLLQPGQWANINSAVDLIEYRLRHHAMVFGREVSEGLWRIDVEPLSVTFVFVGNDITVESIGLIG